MSVSFNKTTAFNPNHVCIICQNPLEKKQVVAHDSPNRADHPMHKSCLQVWIKTNPICPFCRKGINTKSLLSWKEKAPPIIKKIVVNTLTALTMIVFLAIITVLPAALAVGAAYISAGAGMAIAITAGATAAIGAAIIESVIIKTVRSARAEKSARSVSQLNGLQRSMANEIQNYQDEMLDYHHRRLRRLGPLLTPELRIELQRSQTRFLGELHDITEEAPRPVVTHKC
ncbi:MAG: RING finger protein [Chlamydiota bacterium]